MARVTIEDCIGDLSRFELVVLAAQRAKEIGMGSPVMVKKDNDKNAVLALREIAACHINLDALRESLIKKFQKRQSMDSIDEESVEIINEDVSEISKEMQSYQVREKELEHFDSEDDLEEVDEEELEAEEGEEK